MKAPEFEKGPSDRQHHEIARVSTGILVMSPGPFCRSTQNGMIADVLLASDQDVIIEHHSS